MEKPISEAVPALPPVEAQLSALVQKWRAEGAAIDGFHATMGVGFKKCADELEKVLAEAIHSPQTRFCEAHQIAAENETCPCCEAVHLDDELKAEKQGHLVDVTYLKTALQEERRRSSPQTWQPDHSQCHDLVCNGDRTKPRGAKGVSCSCAGRDAAYAELQELKVVASPRGGPAKGGPQDGVLKHD